MSIKSRRGVKCEYLHSKVITKHKLELPTHLVQKLESLCGGSFYKKKNTFVQYLSNGTMGTFVALKEAELQKLPSKVFFGVFSNFLLFMNAQVLVCTQKPLNITFHGNTRATMVPKAPFER